MKVKGKSYWIDNYDKDKIYTWDYLHQNQQSAHIEVWLIRHGTKYAYLIEEIDPLNFKNKKEVPINKKHRRMEL
jgi:hypothetical protein